MRGRCQWYLLLYGDPFNIVFLLLFRGSKSHPLQPVYVILVDDHEAENDGEPPERMRKHGARLRVAPKLVKAPRGAEPDRVRHEARQRKGPCREPGERDERGADACEEDDVAQRDEPVLPRVEHGEHAVSALGVRGAHELRERVEMGELPREHQRE